MGHMEQMPQRQEQAEAPKELLRLGDMGESMKIQNALALLYFELHHRDTDVSVVQDNRLANDAAIRRAAESEWLGGANDPVDDATHPAAAFRKYQEKHPDKKVDIHDRGQLIEMFKEMGIDAEPPTLH